MTSERSIPAFSYASPQTYPTGLAITPLSPLSTGAAATAWSISPALPAGLSFNASNGTITGTPTLASSATTYTVMASNAFEADTAVVVLMVTPTVESLLPPTGITYAASPAVYSQNVGITLNRPSLTGGTDSLAYELSSGALPPGVNLNPANGNLYGTPSDTGYFSAVVRVSNRVGFAQASVDLYVRNPTPVISYAPGSFAYPLGSAITTLSPANAGGEVRSWSIVPDLTANTGLTFSTSTGKVFGTPTKISADTAYTITAQGMGELAVHSVPLVVRISPVAPTVTYDHAPLSFEINAPITPITKTGAGGRITAYAIQPALPAGLVFNTTTGAVSGTPYAAAALRFYVVTATGPGGTGSDSVSLAITANAPTVTYDDGAQVYPVNNAITPLSKTGVTGIITSYSISPTLPSGLSLSRTTGRISGTPTVAVAATFYTITAHGPGGTGSDSVRIATTAVAPTVSYTDVPVVLSVGAETSVQKTGRTGIITSFALAPALPDGLSFSMITGAISGRPSVLSAATDYIITVTGPGGTGSDTINIATATAAPTVSYDHTPQTYPVGEEIVPFAKSGATGIITAYSISPALPAGLSFNPTTGKITGTPRVVEAARDHIVTAIGPGGMARDTINIATETPAPTVTYPDSALEFLINVPITDIVKTGTTGIIARYSISPSLPAGLVFNPTTGKILGTPRAVALARDYIVTAAGPGGVGYDTLNITVRTALLKAGLDERDVFSFRVTGRSGSRYALRIPAAFGTAERVTVSVADLSGRVVWSRSVDPRAAENGARELVWDGKTTGGRTVSAGMYTVRLSVQEHGETRVLRDKVVTGSP